MKKYLSLDASQLHKDLGTFLHPEHLKLHVLLQQQAMTEIANHLDVRLLEITGLIGRRGFAEGRHSHCSRDSRLP